MKSKLEKTIQDLMRVGELPANTEDLIRSNIESLFSRNIDVIIRDNKNDANKSERNKFSWNTNSITICRWQYDEKKDKWIDNKKLQFMWRLFHEIGHSFDTRILKTEPNLKREIFAWKKAEELLKNYFNQYGNFQSFNETKEIDLENYYKYEKIK